MNEKQELNSYFVKDYIEFLNGNDFKIDNLLKYAFYLLVKKNDELSLNFAYSIIINYTLKFKDYKPLIEFSIIFGYSPILNIIYNNFHFESPKEIENFIVKFYIEDNRYKNKVLTSGQKVIYKMMNIKNDYSIVAPTSFGKTDLMLESALNAKGDSIIIVPLIALLNQVKTDLHELARKNGKKVKVITHYEIKRSDNYNNIYVLTQERCFELLKNNELNNITDLFIDEAHKLLLKDDRVYKLSQIIFLLKKKFDCSIRYYSPVLINPSSIKIKGLHEEGFETVNGIRDMKCYNYYFYHKNNKVVYIPNTIKITSDYIIESGYKDFEDYIIKNSKSKNIIFYNSPKNVEQKAMDFLDKIEDTIEIDCKDLIDFIGNQYYILDVIKKGIIYIHGQMPDLVKFYLLNLYKNVDGIKYLFTNSSILEGVNTPSDNLFIGDYNIGNNKIMQPKDFINLRGRINRISDIVSKNDLSRLVCDTHFYAITDHRKNRIRNEIINPCYGIKLEDEVKNEYLEAYTELEKSEKFKTSLEQINLIDNTIDTESVFSEPIIENNNIVINECLLNGVFLNEQQKKCIDLRLEKYNGKQIDNLYDIISAINKIFDLKNSEEIAISRLSNDEARKFYSMLLQWIIEGKTIKEKVSRMTNHYKNVSKNELIYVDKRGDICAELINGQLIVRPTGFSSIRVDKNGNPLRLSPVWTYNNHDTKKLYNICIIKIKVEEDFISFKLIPYIETLNSLDSTIINNELYKLLKYKTCNQFEIELIKEGISTYLAKILNQDKYRKFVCFSDFGVIINDEILGVFNENEILFEELKTLIS